MAARSPARARYVVHPDFLFSQMTAPELVAKDWEPGFVDYFYLSFTNATAFSPTDTLPLTRWAKLVMMFQSARVARDGGTGHRPGRQRHLLTRCGLPSGG